MSEVGAPRESTRVPIVPDEGCGSTSIAKEQPARDAPQDNGRGVRDGVGVDVVVLDVVRLEVIVGDTLEMEVEE